MAKFQFAFFSLGVLLISFAFALSQKNIIYLEKIEIKVEDSTFKLEKIMLIKGQDSLIYKLNKNPKPIKINMSESLKLQLISSDDTLEIDNINETFEENENFSLRIEIPNNFDYCYYLTYFDNYGAYELGFWSTMKNKPSMIIDDSNNCLMVFISSNYL